MLCIIGRALHTNLRFNDSTPYVYACFRESSARNFQMVNANMYAQEKKWGTYVVQILAYGVRHTASTTIYKCHFVSPPALIFFSFSQ